MQSRPLGPSGIEASVVGLGTWAIGGWMWGGTDEADSIEAIRAAIDRGVTLIDTAPAYGQGLAEQIVGKAIADRREGLIVATKCGLRWDREEGHFHFTDLEGRKIYKNLRPDSIRQELDASLQRLGLDTIDLYQTHWQDPTTPIEETVGCLLELRAEGKIRAIGASNATSQHLAEYRRHAPLDSDQEKYSMIDRQIEQDQLPYCAQHDIAMLAYSPMAMGLLTGKVTPDRQFEESDIRSRQPRFSIDNRKRIAALLDELRPLAESHRLNLAQYAVAWARAQPGLTHALVGVRNLRQAQQATDAGDAKISDEELEQVRAILARHKDIE